MKKNLLTIVFLTCVVYAHAQTEWLLHSSPATVRNAFNNNFNYVYSNKADKTNPIIIGIIKISNGTSVTDTVATQAYARIHGSGTTGGIDDATMRAAIEDSLNALRDNATPIENVAVITADSLTNLYATKKYARDYAVSGSGWLDSLSVLSSAPASGNIYINSGDKKIHYLVGGYWHRLAILDSTSVEGSSSTLLDGLISYWKMNDASSNAVDSYAANTGIVSDGTPTYSVAGKVGTAITFAGAEHFLVGTTTSLRLAHISVSFTFKTTTSDYLGLVTNTWDDGTNYYGFSIATELNLIRAYGYNGGAETSYVEETTNVTTGAWFHVVFTSDGTNLKLYINGTQEGGNVSFPYNLVYNGSCNFDIGARNNGGIPFIGTMDEVKVWNRALTSTEVTEDYSNVTNGTPLL